MITDHEGPSPGEEFRPVLGTPADFPEQSPGRGRFLGYIIIGLFVAVAAAGWGYVVLVGGGNPQVRAQVISFEVLSSDSAEITFSVHKPADRAATCRLRALDTRHAEVGSREIDIPSGRSDLSFRERLRTSALATAVHVQYCDLV
jgi:hypothetical protein